MNWGQFSCCRWGPRQRGQVAQCQSTEEDPSQANSPTSLILSSPITGLLRVGALVPYNRSPSNYRQQLLMKMLPSVLWRCWLGGRKGIRGWGTDVVVCLERGGNEMICIWSSWCHCHPIISCCCKIQNGLPFWCQITQVLLEKRLLNGSSSSSSSSN